MTTGGPQSTQEIAEHILGSPAQPYAPQRMTTRASWYEDSLSQRLVAVVSPGAGLTAADEALAYGLAWQGDRDLILVMPEDLVSTTLVRLPWIATDVRVHAWDGHGDPHPVSAPSRRAALEVMREYEPRRTGEHALTPMQHAWIAGIDTAALTERHRPSYLAWHLDGLQVLKVARAKGGRLRVQAGVQYSTPQPGRSVFDAVITDALTTDQLGHIHARVADALQDGGSRTSQMREHKLQHDLEQDHGTTLGLNVLIREYPAYRGTGPAAPGTPGAGRPGFIDFLALDRSGRLHVVETKVGHDPCVLLQALDYAIWVEANQDNIRTSQPQLATAATSTPVAIDLVLAAKTREPAFNTYLAGQIEALCGDVPIRVHLVPDLDDPLTNRPLRRADMWTAQPGLVAAPATQPRWPDRLTPDLITARGTAAGLLGRDDKDAVLPDATAALADLRTRGLTHRYVRHVRSSQAFALNLFAPLDENGRTSVMRMLGLTVTHADPPVFEFEDTQDRLAEASPRSPHRTQVDVLLTGTTADGARVAALIEVKLAETDFGHCSAYSSPNNTHQHVCMTPGLFGDNPDQCFQLRNHGHGQRRYADHLADVPLTPPALVEDHGGCWVRRGRSQPMRNLALAHLLVTHGDVDRAVYALCAPEGHRAIWRRYGEFTATFGSTPTVSTAALLAHDVALMHPDNGEAFFDRYGPAVPPQALAHLSPTADELHGVWIMTPAGPESHYAPGRDAEADYAQGLIPGQDWSYLLDRLPDTSPYMAWWQRFDHAPGATAEQVYQSAQRQMR